ncbi:glycoside hydrolase family 99-like domain-containing protein [Lachnospiraceae bacterium 45-P1]
MKIIAFYLPQFHNIPENDEWWGDGFTEWVNVKKAKPLYAGHIQPKVPLNENYYDLLDDDVKIWQMQIAKKYGIYGFCYYHYWFNGKMLLEKPMEQMLANKDIDMPFCICWANEAWTKAWINSTQTLIPQKYGGKQEWKEHFDYLLQFFKDNRYIKCNGKPLLVIYKPELIECGNDMIDYFQVLAKESGFPGLCMAYQHGNMDFYSGKKDDSRYDLDIEFQPIYARYDHDKACQASGVKVRLKDIYHKTSILLGKKLGIEINIRSFAKNSNSIRTYDYDKIWNYILDKKVTDPKRVPGAFAMWDNTPRHGMNGHVYTGSTPKKFETYLERLIKKTKEEYHKDMIFVYAWNEWAEGGYLEPDTENGYGYLEAIQNALMNTNEFETR